MAKVDRRRAYVERNPEKVRISNRLSQRRLRAVDPEGSYAKSLHNKGIVPTRPEPAHCEICAAPPSGNRKHLCADHHHLTGIFRGWICDSCNRGLGCFKDLLVLVRHAVAYLERSKEEA